MVTTEANFLIDRRQGVFSSRAGESLIVIPDFGGQGPFRHFQFLRDPVQFDVQLFLLPFDFALELLEFRGDLLALLVLLGQQGPLLIDLFETFQDFVRENVIGLFVRGDLFLQGLIFSIVTAAVQFSFEIFNSILTLLQLQLFAVGRHLGSLERFLDRGAFFFQFPQIGFRGLHLSRPLFQTAAQVPDLSMNSMDFTKS